jgi:hypothetical protein
MGRLSDIVLRGLQFEAEREARELENEGRRLQMESVIRQRVAERRRTTPEYVKAWDAFQNPETRTADLGQFAPALGDDIPAALEARAKNQAIKVQNDFALSKMREQNEALLGRMEARFTQQDETNKMLEAGRNARSEATDERLRTLAADFANLRRELDDKPKKPTYTPDDALDVVSRRLFQANFNELAKLDGIAIPLGKNVTQEQALAVASEAADDLIRLQDAGMDRGAALATVLRNVKRETKKGKLVSISYVPSAASATPGVATPAPAPARPDTARAAVALTATLTEEQEDKIEAAVQRAVANGQADTPDLREALRKRLLARGGK